MCKLKTLAFDSIHEQNFYMHIPKDLKFFLIFGSIKRAQLKEGVLKYESLKELQV